MALPSHLLTIEPCGVRAIDDFFPASDVQRLVDTVASIPLYFLNHARYQRTHELYCHWEYPLVIVGDEPPRDVASELEQLDESLEPIVSAWRKSWSLLPSGAVTVNCYINGYTYGTDGFPHFEIRGEQGSEQRTVLIYCCPRWEPAWGGETVFFDRDGDVSAAILPKPGRVLVFRGDVLHVARSPSRFCPIERRVLVFKYWINGLPAPAGG